MPEFLNEDYITIAPELIFPAVQSCCAVVATASGINNLAGYHMTLFASSLFGVGSNDRSCLATDVFRFG